MFRKYRGMAMTYERQGYIYFFCRNYGALSPEGRRRVRECCDRVGGEYSQALLRLLTGRASSKRIAAEDGVSESTLHRLRRQFYSEFEVK